MPTAGDSFTAAPTPNSPGHRRIARMARTASWRWMFLYQNSMLTGSRATSARATSGRHPATQARQAAMSPSHAYSNGHAPRTIDTGAMTCAIGGGYW